MHKLAHWRLENGERMKILDQLLGSTGLFSAIITQFKFRNMGFVGVGLILLWILSPIGGQASLRALDYGTIIESQPRTMYYLDWNSTYQPSQKTIEAEESSSESNFVASRLFTSALASTRAVQKSSMDSWGNVKIPMLERLSSPKDSDGWQSVDNSTNVTYSSLIGVPISAFSPTHNTTFSLETSYWVLDCPIIRDVGSDPDNWFLPGENNSLPSNKEEGWIVGFSRAWAISTPSSLGSNLGHEYDTNFTQRNIYYRGFDDDSGMSQNATKAECSISTTYVEVAGRCLSQNCAIMRMRASTKRHPPPVYALGMDNSAFMIEDFHSAVDPEIFQRPTPLERFFVNPYAPFTSTNKDNALHKIPNIEFSTSFAQLLNAYWQSSISLGQVTSGIPPDDEIPKEELHRNMTRDMSVYNTINATESRTIPVVKAQRLWLAALFVATGAMFLAGVFGLVLEATRKAPDFSLNVSSLTRDNPYIRLPAGGSTLDSLDRGRLLQNVRIRMGDVRPDDPVGYIAIASCDEEGRVTRLKEMERVRTFS